MNRYLELGIWKIVLERRINLGLKQEALADMISCSSAYISKIEKGKSLPSPSMTVKLEKALGFSDHPILSCLMKQKLSMGESFPITKEELLGSTPVKDSLSEHFQIPLLGRVPASPIGKEFTYDQVEEWISVPRSMIKGKKMYFVRAKGDSMSPVINEGAIVLIDAENHDPLNGDIVIAIIDGEWTLKRFYRQNGHVILKPDNPAYQPRFYDDKNEITLRGVLHGIFPKGL